MTGTKMFFVVLFAILIAGWLLMALYSAAHGAGY